MAKIKGQKKLTMAVKKELSAFGINKVSFEDEYCYYPEGDKIAYTIIRGEVDDYFNDFVKKRFGYDVGEYEFIISILHEVGHHFTLEDVRSSDVIYEFCQREKERIHKELNKKGLSKKKIKKLNFEYFNLPDEIVATEWAVQYMIEHEEEIKFMWARLRGALYNFYTKNIDEEDM